MGIAALDGLRVVELGTVVAGPFAGSLLADLGADVIKVEPEGQGDVLRRLGPARDGMTIWWGVSSRDKRCVGVDLKSGEGAAHLRRLLADADVLVSNYRPGALVRMGLGPADLDALNPALIHVSISGYGAPGPKSHLPGFGKIAEGMSGVVNLTGRPDQMPLFCGFSLGDTTTGLFAALGAVLALCARDRSGGRAPSVDIALYDALLRVGEAQLIDARETGRSPVRSGTNHPYGGGRGGAWPRVVSARTAAGDWVAVHSPDAASAEACRTALGMAGDGPWDEALRSWSASLPAEEIRDALAAFGQDVAPVLDGQSLARHPYIAARGDVVTVRDGCLGDLAVPGHVDPAVAATGRGFHRASLNDPASVAWREPAPKHRPQPHSDDGLFADLSIVELSATPGASFAATLFADYGATVHVLEPSDGGSPLRRLSSSLWQALGRNKRSFAATPSADDAKVRALLERADVVITDVPRRQWPDHPWLSLLPADHRRAAVATIFPTGADRPDLWPWSTNPALAAAASGIMAITGWENAPPVLPEVPLADYCAGALAALRVAAALWRGTARGLVVEEPLHRALLRMIEWQCPAASILGVPPLRLGNRLPLNMGIGNLCLSSDGKYVSVSVAGDKTVTRLLYLIGGDTLLHDPRFATPEARTAHGDEVYGQIIAWAAGRTAAEIMQTAIENDIVMGIVCDAQEIFADSHIQARGSVISLDACEDAGAFVAVTPRVSGWVRPLRSAAPSLGTGALCDRTNGDGD